MKVEQRVRQVLAAIAAFGCVTAGAVESARADQTVGAGFNLPATFGADVSFDCKNSPGPSITLLDGKIALGGVQGLLTLSNNTRFTHYTDPGVIVDTAVLLDLGTT